MYRKILKSILSPNISKIFSIDCYAVLMKASSYGIFQSKKINPDGDISVEFMTGDIVPIDFSLTRSILSQSISTNLNLKEFYLRLANPTGHLQLIVGGATFPRPEMTIKPNSVYKVTLFGNDLNYFENGIVKGNYTVTRGSAREPFAKTVFCARANNSLSSFINNYGGVIVYIKINSDYYPLSNKNTPVQQSVPDNGNPITLYGVEPSDWSQIPCNLRQ